MAWRLVSDRPGDDFGAYSFLNCFSINHNEFKMYNTIIVQCFHAIAQTRDRCPESIPSSVAGVERRFALGSWRLSAQRRAAKCAKAVMLTTFDEYHIMMLLANYEYKFVSSCEERSTNQIQFALTSREASERSHSGMRRDGADQHVKAVGADGARREVLRQGRRCRIGGAPPGPGCSSVATNQIFSLLRNNIRFVVVPTSICNVHTLRVLRRRRLPQETMQRN